MPTSQRGYTPRVKLTKACRSCSLAASCVLELQAQKLYRLPRYIKRYLERKRKYVKTRQCLSYHHAGSGSCRWLAGLIVVKIDDSKTMRLPLLTTCRESSPASTIRETVLLSWVLALNVTSA